MSSGWVVVVVKYKKHLLCVYFLLYFFKVFVVRGESISFDVILKVVIDLLKIFRNNHNNNICTNAVFIWYKMMKLNTLVRFNDYWQAMNVLFEFECTSCFLRIEINRLINYLSCVSIIYVCVVNIILVGRE